MSSRAERRVVTSPPGTHPQLDIIFAGVSTPCDCPTVATAEERRVWWNCSKGHEWRQQVRTKVDRAAGCPHCAAAGKARG